MLLVLLTTLHVLVCVFLIIVVLLQSGKAADLAGAFGGMGSQTAFGPRGSATLLSKATTASAVVFMITSLSLSILATRNAGQVGGSTVLDKAKTPATAPAKVPLTPTTPAAPGKPAGAGTDWKPAGQLSAPDTDHRRSEDAGAGTAESAEEVAPAEVAELADALA